MENDKSDENLTNGEQKSEDVSDIGKPLRLTSVHSRETTPTGNGLGSVSSAPVGGGRFTSVHTKAGE